MGLAACLAAAAACGGTAGPEKAGGERVPMPPAGIDHGPWSRLLEKYVDERGQVAYGRWKDSPADRAALALFLARYAAVERPAQGADRMASLINLYNAATIHWILAHYPTRSIQALPSSFTGERIRVSGQRVSLDEIERALEPLAGYRVHAALVCAARSCPPLARAAYRAEGIEADLDAAMRRWLAREDLNRFRPADNRADISSIFRWHSDEFQSAGGTRAVLARFAPERYREFLSGPDYAITYLRYDWGLNDQGPEGRSYGGLKLLWDKLRAKLRV